MNRRTVLAGVGSMGIAATAGCGGILGGGGCSISADSAGDLLPEEGNGFTQQNSSSGEGSGEDVESQAFATYTDEDDNRYVFAATEYSSSSARQDAEDESTGSGQVDGTFLVVTSGKWVAGAGGGQDVSESQVRDLMGQSSLSSACVNAAEEPDSG